MSSDVVSPRVPGWNPLRFNFNHHSSNVEHVNSVASEDEALHPSEGEQLFSHGSHDYPLRAMPPEVKGGLCSVCQAALVPSKANCYTSTVTPLSFLLCQKCFEVAETPLQQPTLVMRQPTVPFSDGAAVIRTRPRHDAHALLSVPFGYVTPVVASTQDTEGRIFYRRRHGGWIPGDAVGIVIPSPLRIGGLFLGSLQDFRGVAGTDSTITNLRHFSEYVQEVHSMLKRGCEVQALSAALHLHGPFHRVLETFFQSGCPTPTKDCEEASCALLSDDHDILSRMVDLSVDVLESAATLLGKVPPHLYAPSASFVNFLLTVVGQCAEQLRELLQGSSCSPPRCSLNRRQAAIIGPALSKTIAAASTIATYAVPTVPHDSIAAGLRRCVHGATFVVPSMWHDLYVTGGEPPRSSSAWEECCVRAMHVTFAFLLLAERALGGHLASLSFLGCVRRLVQCNIPGLWHIGAQALNVAFRCLSTTSSNSLQTDVFNADLIDMALSNIHSKPTDHTSVVAISVITHVLRNRSDFVSMVGTQVALSIAPLLQLGGHLSLHHGNALLELLAAVGAHDIFLCPPQEQEGDHNSTAAYAEEDEPKKLTEKLPSGASGLTEICDPSEVFVTVPKCASMLSLRPMPQRMFYACSPLVSDGVARVVCCRCARRLVSECRSNARVYASNDVSYVFCEGDLFLTPAADVQGTFDANGATAFPMKPTPAQSALLNVSYGLAPFVAEQLRLHGLDVANNAARVIVALYLESTVADLYCVLLTATYSDLVTSYLPASLAAAAFKHSQHGKCFAENYPNTPLIEFVRCKGAPISLQSRGGEEPAGDNNVIGSTFILETNAQQKAPGGHEHHQITPGLHPQRSPFGLTPSPT